MLYENRNKTVQGNKGDGGERGERVENMLNLLYMLVRKNVKYLLKN